MRLVCLVFLLCGCHGPASVADLKQPLLSVAIQTGCVQYIVLDGDNVAWTQTGCTPNVFLDQHGSVTADARDSFDVAFEDALGEDHSPYPNCFYTDTVYRAERWTPTIDGFYACESPGKAPAPATYAFIGAMKGLAP